MPYEKGTAYINENNNIGQLTVEIRGMTGEEVGEAEGMSGDLGRMLADQLSDPETRELIKEFLSDKDHHLFYSRAEDGTEIISIPGMKGEYEIDHEFADGIVLATYSINGEIPEALRVYNHHTEAIGDLPLRADRTALEEEVLGLASKTNDVYAQILEKIIEMGF